MVMMRLFSKKSWTKKVIFFMLIFALYSFKTETGQFAWIDDEEKKMVWNERLKKR